MTRRPRIRILSMLLIWHIVHTYASVTKQYNLVPVSHMALMPYRWEGNHRSGITLAMRQLLRGLSTCGLKA